MLARLAVSVVFLGLHASALRGQEVIQPDTVRPAAWKARFDFGFNFASGNSSFTVLSSELRLARTPTAISEFEWSAGIEYGRNEGAVVEKRIVSSVKYDYLPKHRLSPFAFATAEQDEARKIDLQAYGGAGLKVTLWQSDVGKASVSGAVVYNYETFAAPLLTAAPSERTTRWSVRFKGARKVSPVVELENTTFYQPVFESAADYNLSAASSVITKATSHFSIFVRHLYRRDSTPREGVKSEDQRVTAGLRIDF